MAGAQVPEVAAAVGGAEQEVPALHLRWGGPQAYERHRKRSGREGAEPGIRSNRPIMGGLVGGRAMGKWEQPKSESKRLK